MQYGDQMLHFEHKSYTSNNNNSYLNIKFQIIQPHLKCLIIYQNIERRLLFKRLNDTIEEHILSWICTFEYNNNTL